jgi:cytochrome d ubiquinol oxidase subunit II
MVTLAQFWCAVIVLALLVYVVLDGFDLGVGMLIGMTSDTKHRARMLKTIDPVWDGNETWLVVVGATLYATFPTAYAILLPAFYAAFVCMLLALIFRGIGIEARNRSERARLRWDRAIIIGSAVAAFSQGVIVGNLTGGIAVENGQFVGVTLDSFTVFSVIAGVGCIVGYALHGLSWLVLKTDGELRAWAYARIPTFALGWCMILAILFWRMLQNHPEVLAKWSVISPLLFLPAIGLLACGGLAYGVHRRIDGVPFAMTTILFLVAGAMFVLTLQPYIVPWSITVAEAAAPQASLSFLLFGGAFALPVILIYTSTVYWVFRGKVPDS